MTLALTAHQIVVYTDQPLCAKSEAEGDDGPMVARVRRKFWWAKNIAGLDGKSLFHLGSGRKFPVRSGYASPDVKI